MTTYAPTNGQTSSPLESGESKDNKGVSSRRLKKREIDRRCQRQARERTKSRIAYLEGVVEDFRRKDASGQVATLMKQLEEVEAERELMAKTLRDIQKAMDIHKPVRTAEEPALGNNIRASRMECDDANLERKPSLTPLPDDASLPLKAEGVDIRIQNIPTGSFDLANYPPPPDLPLQSPDRLFAPEIVRLDNNSQRPTNRALVQSRAAGEPNHPPLRYASHWAVPRQACSCHSCHDRDHDRPPGRLTNFQGNYWKYVNEVLAERFDWNDVQAAPDSTCDDVPIRALVEGWDSVLRRGPLHPSWNIIRRVDQLLFANCPNIERLAIMRAMHLLIQFHTESTTERYSRLPPWYMRRPSQNLAHSYAIDYFPWPGVRERFIFNEHDYCGNEFWHLFCKSLRVRWPYEFRDCYTREVETGLYKLSPMFDQRMTDIRSWTMNVDFFRRYPELYSDIPVWNDIPQSLSPGVGVGVGMKSRQKRIGSAPASPKVTPTEGVYEEEQAGIKPPSTGAMTIANPIPIPIPQMHVHGQQYHQRPPPPSHHLHRQHDPSQHMYNVSDFNPTMALDAFAYGAITEADFANVFVPEMQDDYHHVNY